MSAPPPTPPAASAPPPGTTYSVGPPPYAYLPPSEPAAAPADSDEVFSLTFSPLHLLLPVVQLTGELRATPHFGVSMILGYGSITGEVDDGFGGKEDLKVSAYELGGRLIGYPLKRFKSLELGAQVMYLKISRGKDSRGISGTGAGVALGPLIGYKLVTAAGFTFLAQGGFQYIAVRAEAHDQAGNDDTASDSKFLPLLNLDIGWSF